MNEILEFTIRCDEIGPIGSWFHFTIQLGHNRFKASMEDGFSYFPELIIFLEKIMVGGRAIYRTNTPNSEMEVTYTPITNFVGRVDIRDLYYEFTNKRGLTGLTYTQRFIEEIYLKLILLSNHPSVVKHKDSQWLNGWEIARSAEIELFLGITKN